MNRREFMNRVAAGGIFSAVAPGCAWSRKRPKTESRPNILWIMTDQQFAGAMSCAGNPDVSTPAMDWIASHGVRFDQAYCTNPICVPSRSSMMTGKYTHEINVSTNYKSRDIDSPSLGTLMRRAGYRTGYAGKWHIPEPSQGNDWPGFDSIEHTVRKGVDSKVASSCSEFIQQERDKPWFFVASYENPHDICEWARIAAGIEDELPNGAIPPAPPPDECPELPPNFEVPSFEPSVIRELKMHSKADRTYPTEGWDGGKWRQYRWTYYKLVEKVDAQIGDILETLKNSNHLENTVILFTSDHGDGMGAHKWNQKTLFYEECARVPFIIAGKDVSDPGRLDSSTLVSTGLDIAATILDYAGTPLPGSYYGCSQRPVVEGRSALGHEYVVSENDLAPEYNKTGGIYGRMLRAGKYKYVVYSEGKYAEQLFNLEADPGEMENLAVQTTYAAELEQHREILKQHLQRTLDPFTAEVI